MTIWCGFVIFISLIFVVVLGVIPDEECYVKCATKCKKAKMKAYCYRTTGLSYCACEPIKTSNSKLIPSNFNPVDSNYYPNDDPVNPSISLSKSQQCYSQDCSRTCHNMGMEGFCGSRTDGGIYCHCKKTIEDDLSYSKKSAVSSKEGCNVNNMNLTCYRKDESWICPCDKKGEPYAKCHLDDCINLCQGKYQQENAYCYNRKESSYCACELQNASPNTMYSDEHDSNPSSVTSSEVPNAESQLKAATSPSLSLSVATGDKSYFRPLNLLTQQYPIMGGLHNSMNRPSFVSKNTLQKVPDFIQHSQHRGMNYGKIKVSAPFRNSVYSANSVMHGVPNSINFNPRPAFPAVYQPMAARPHSMYNIAPQRISVGSQNFMGNVMPNYMRYSAMNPVHPILFNAPYTALQNLNSQRFLAGPPAIPSAVFPPATNKVPSVMKPATSFAVPPDVRPAISPFSQPVVQRPVQPAVPPDVRPAIPPFSQPVMQRPIQPAVPPKVPPGSARGFPPAGRPAPQPGYQYVALPEVPPTSPAAFPSAGRPAPQPPIQRVMPPVIPPTSPPVSFPAGGPATQPAFQRVIPPEIPPTFQPAFPTAGRPAPQQSFLRAIPSGTSPDALSVISNADSSTASSDTLPSDAAAAPSKSPGVAHSPKSGISSQRTEELDIDGSGCK